MSWTNVTMSLDLDAKTSRLGFTDVNSTTVESADLAWSAPITDTTVTTLNLQMRDGVTKNYFDDFSFDLVSAVPEPSCLMLGLVGICALTIRRVR